MYTYLCDVYQEIKVIRNFREIKTVHASDIIVHWHNNRENIYMYKTNNSHPAE